MLHLILVRHGETDWNAKHRYQGQSDVPLSNVGIQQAELIAERLLDEKIDAIYASDLKRAWMTAEAVAKNHKLKVIPEPRLRELKFGILEGLTFEEAETEHPEMIRAWLDDFNNTPVGGETIQDFNTRIVSLLESLKQEHKEQVVLLVGHGGSLSEILRVVLGLSREKRWYLEMENASLTEVSITEEYISVKRLNDTCHLRSLRS